jgi:hypothetical protein
MWLIFTTWKELCQESREIKTQGFLLVCVSSVCRGPVFILSLNLECVRKELLHDMLGMKPYEQNANPGKQTAG